MRLDEDSVRRWKWTFRGVLYFLACQHVKDAVHVGGAWGEHTATLTNGAVAGLRGRTKTNRRSGRARDDR